MRDKINHAIQVLEYHNRWRRDEADTGSDERLEMLDPKEIGIAIDTAVDVLSKLSDVEAVSDETKETKNVEILFYQRTETQ